MKRLAVIGTTQIAKSHIDAARKAGFDVCHVAGSKNSRTVDSFATSCGIHRAWSDPDALVVSGEWDAIVISSAIDSLPELLQLAMKSNKAVLVEKPVALDPHAFDKFRGSTEKVIVGFNRRFYAAALEAKKFLAERSAGVIQLHIPESTILKPDGEWDYTRVKTNSTHAIDLLNFLTGGLHDVKINSVFRDSQKIAAVANAWSDRGDLCSVVANWNATANFTLTIDCGEERFELKPLEHGVIYRGFEVKQSNSNKNRIYIPKKMMEFSESVDSDFYKPGFLGQAHALLNLTHGTRSPIAATLNDAKKAQIFADLLIND